jgi:hypothetical protein
MFAIACPYCDNREKVIRFGILTPPCTAPSMASHQLAFLALLLTK